MLHQVSFGAVLLFGQDTTVLIIENYLSHIKFVVVGFCPFPKATPTALAAEMRSFSS